MELATVEPLAVMPPTEIDIGALIRTAVDKGYDADQLDKLLTLHERIEKRKAEAAYNIAMTACQKELPTVIRDKQNSETRKKYASLEEMQSTIKPIYHKHGFSLSFGTADSHLENHYRIVVDIMHVGGDTRTKFIDIPLDNKGPKGSPNKTDTQGAVSSISYGQRVLTRLSFNVTEADQDRDGQQPSSTITEQQEIEVNELIKDCQEAGNPVDVKRFLDWLKITTISDMPADKFATAIDHLKRRKAAKR